MNRPLGSRLLEAGAWAMAAGLGAAGLGLAWLAYARAQLPYSETGSYFDGDVVLHAQAIEVFALLAVLCLLAACAMWWCALRVRRRHVRAASG